MKTSLMLIESPNKEHTISKFLKGKNIQVFATIGHIRELDERSFNGLGFDEKTYEMNWRNDSRRTFKGKEFDVIKEINARADKSEEIFLSTDPDREGEAISWHIYSILSKKNQQKCKRIVFNEITEAAIHNAFKNPRQLDQDQINSYWARKILDRGIGFKLSNFSQKFIGGRSAGRVQSIALKFLKDKYDEINQFVPDHWFNVDVHLENGLALTLTKLKDSTNVELKDGSPGRINFANEEDAQKVLDSLSDNFTLVNISEPKKERRSPPKPFKTSTMQSTAISSLGFSVSNVDRASQKLYEGLQVDGEFISLITYPRTDREDLSDTFTKEAKDWIAGACGKQYVAAGRRVSKKNKDKEMLVQGAHEAIRPTYIDMTPDMLEGKIDSQCFRLYKLIWLRAVASLMSDATYDNVLYSFDNEGNEFVVNNRIETFDGFRLLARKFSASGEDASEDKIFPALTLNKEYKAGEKGVKQVDKAPPSPYTEATLIKSLEDRGIGRPSTYSNIVNIILNREYAQKEEGKLIITPLGVQMSSDLSQFFPNVMQYDYTKNMELALDNISEAKSDWKEFLDHVFLVFNGELSNALTQVKNLVVGVCPECGGMLKKKFAARGSFRQPFVGCDRYPDCKYIQKTPKEQPETTGETCPKCGSDLVKKVNKNKRAFVGCSNFPTCTYIKGREEKAVEEVGRTCPRPNCNGKLIKKFNKWNKPFISCNRFPDCKYIESLEEKEQVEELCPNCSSKLWKHSSKYNNGFYLKCETDNCKFYKALKKENNGESQES